MSSESRSAHSPLSRLERIPVWPYSYGLILMIGLGYFFAFFDITNISYGLPVIIAQFHVSTEAASSAISSSLIGYIIGAIAVSVISDYWGRRKSLLIGIGLYTAGSFLTAFSMSLTWLIVWRFIVGMGIGAMIAQVSTYMGEISPATLRERFSGFANLFAVAGIAAVPFVALGLVPNFSWGWRGLLFVGGLGGLSMLFISKSLIESPRWLLIHGRVQEAEKIIHRAEQTALKKMGGTPLPEPIAVMAEESAHGFPMSHLFRRPYFKWMLLLVFYWLIFYIGDYSFLGMAPIFLVQKGFSLAGSIGYSAISAGGFIVGAIYIMVFGDRVERKYSLMVVGFIGALLVTLISFDPTPLTIVIGGFFFTLTITLFSILGYIITAEHFPTRARSSGLAMCDGVGHLGGAIAPPLALWAYSIWGFAGGFMVMGLATFLALILISFSKRTTGKTLESVSIAEETLSANM